MSHSKVQLWMRGLFAALVSGLAGGVSTALGTAIALPEQAGNPMLLVKTSVIAGIASSVIGVMGYLKQSPLPPEEE